MVIGFEIHVARGNKLSTLDIYGGGRQGSRAHGIARTTRRRGAAE